MADYFFQHAYRLDPRGKSRNYGAAKLTTTSPQKISDSSSQGILASGEPVTTPQGNGSFHGTTIGGFPVIKVGDTLYLFSDNANLNGTIKPSDFTTISNYSVLCLTQGSRIRMASGESVDISELHPGDSVQTLEGPRPVRFIGQSSYSLFQLHRSGKLPVRIEARALGDLGPSEPIHCTPNHAFLIKGCLVEAQALINRTTVRQLESWEEASITYYSLELEEHSLVWANDLLTETYVATERGGTITRESWSNYGDYLDRFGTSAPMTDMPMPRIPFARQLPAEIRAIARLELTSTEAPVVLV
jgi:hypothetical protein